LSDADTGGLQLGNINGIIGECIKIRNNGKNKYKKFTEDINVSKFESYEPFNKDKKRIFNYTKQETSSEIQVQNFELTYSDVNTGEPSTFNYKQSFN